jgi:hypothetical protein
LRHATGLEQATAAELDHARDIGFTESHPVAEPLLAVPGWRTTELELVATDALDARQHFRLVVAERAGVIAALYVPETLAREAPGFFVGLLGSIH